MIRVQKFLQVLLALAAPMLSAAPSAEAGPIFLSGDSDIVQSDPGNLLFFQNILSGGNRVVIQESPTFSASVEGLNNFYNSLSGVNSSITTGPLTASSLMGVNLFISIFPDAPYTGNEITVMNNLVAADGSIFFLGENGPFGSVQNANINGALLGLGSGLRIIDAELDGGFHFATGSQIVNDPFTAGISTFTYGNTSEVSGGTPLFLATTGEAFIAYQQQQQIPEPNTMPLLGIGIAGMIYAAIRKKRQAPENTET